MDRKGPSSTGREKSQEDLAAMLSGYHEVPADAGPEQTKKRMQEASIP